MVADILKGILIVVIGVPAVAVAWAIMNAVARSASYLAHGSVMTGILGVIYYLFSNSSAWGDPRLRIFFGGIVAVAYAVGFAAAYRNRIERNYVSVSSNE